MPLDDLVSLIKNFPPFLTQISAWARETTLDLKASLFVPRALTAARPIPERSVKRPMRRAGSISRKSRVMASNRRERRESRCGTSRMQNVALAGVAPVPEMAAGSRDAWR